MRRLLAPARSAWEWAVGAAYVAGCFVDLATRRRVGELEKRLQTVELELALRSETRKERQFGEPAAKAPERKPVEAPLTPAEHSARVTTPPKTDA